MSRSSLIGAVALVLALGPLAAACGHTAEVAATGTGTATSAGIVLHTSGGKGGRCASPLTTPRSHNAGTKSGRCAATTHDSKGKRPGGGRCAPGARSGAGHGYAGTKNGATGHDSGANSGRCIAGSRDSGPGAPSHANRGPLSKDG